MDKGTSNKVSVAFSKCEEDWPRKVCLKKILWSNKVGKYYMIDLSLLEGCVKQIQIFKCFDVLPNFCHSIWRVSLYLQILHL